MIRFGKREMRRVETDWINGLAQNDPASLVGNGEAYYKKNIQQVADYVADKEGELRILLLAGPSASGKTTTARKIGGLLREAGINAPVISLDDFYRDTVDLPIGPDGQRDYETIDALDVPEIQRCFLELIETGRSDVPRFDFVSKRRAIRRTSIRLGETGVLIVEGIHALNPLLHSLGDAGYFSLYISPLTEVLKDGEVFLSAEDLRLMRRIVRDRSHRGATMQDTLDMWRKVLEGEERYIRPFAASADAMIDTMHYYEPCVYHHYLYGIIDELPKDSRHHETAMHLRDILEVYHDLSSDVVPGDSLLQEFVG